MPPEVMMFWAKRLKEADADADGSGLLSYGDLMSLLLVVFVMIAAMSELRAGERFGRISQGVRQAFGFASVASNGGAMSGRAPTLLEQLEQAGFQRRSKVHLVGADDETLSPCEIIVGGKTVTLRIAGQACFELHSAAIKPEGLKALRRLGEFLTGGTSRIEVRGHARVGNLTVGVPFRDGLDLAYARARAVLENLAQCGVNRERLFVGALNDGDPLLSETTKFEADVDGRIEIVVHAAESVGHVGEIAGKDRKNDG